MEFDKEFLHIMELNKILQNTKWDKKDESYYNEGEEWCVNSYYNAVTEEWSVKRCEYSKTEFYDPVKCGRCENSNFKHYYRAREAKLRTKALLEKEIDTYFIKEAELIDDGLKRKNK